VVTLKRDNKDQKILLPDSAGFSREDIFSLAFINKTVFCGFFAGEVLSGIPLRGLKGVISLCYVQKMLKRS
jgi:hypothetical protein